MSTGWGRLTWGQADWGDSNTVGFLKGPMDMLTLYENKYKQEVQKFAGTQLGRRRRDDYTDGTVRIPVKSPSP